MHDRVSRPDVDAALDLVRLYAPSLPVETIGSNEARGRIVATAPRAALSVPRFHTAAMDGYVLSSRGTKTASPAHPGVLRLLDRLAAAGEVADVLQPGTARRIATGAAIPHGSDAVLPMEHALPQSSGGELVVHAPIAPGRNIRAIGEDAAAGSELLVPGTMVTPASIGLLVAAGVQSVAVRRWPKIRLVSTGTELTSDLSRLDETARIPDSNGPMLAAALHELGLPPAASVHAADDLADIRAVLDDRSADLIITTGGVSVGERDLIPVALSDLRARIHFNGIAMRPGKPILFATLADGRPFFGLPGNPVAALVGFRFFVVALLRAMLGVDPESGVPLPVPVPRRAGTTLFLRGCARHVAAGGLTVQFAADQRSHVLSSVVDANCWVRADSDEERPALLFPQRASLGA